MRHFLAGMLALGLLGVGMAHAAGPGPKASTPNGPSWFTRWLGFGAKPAAPKNEPKKNQVEPKSEPQPVNLVDGGKAERAREEAILLRRQEACQKLREIAQEASDDGLRRKAEQLDQRAWDTYLKRTAHLPGGRPTFQSDQALLEERLGSVTGTRSDWQALTGPTEGTAGYRAQRGEE